MVVMVRVSSNVEGSEGDYIDVSLQKTIVGVAPLTKLMEDGELIIEWQNDDGLIELWIHEDVLKKIVKGVEKCRRHEMS